MMALRLWTDGSESKSRSSAWTWADDGAEAGRHPHDNSDVMSKVVATSIAAAAADASVNKGAIAATHQIQNATPATPGPRAETTTVVTIEDASIREDARQRYLRVRVVRAALAHARQGLTLRDDLLLLKYTFGCNICHCFLCWDNWVAEADLFTFWAPALGLPCRLCKSMHMVRWAFFAAEAARDGFVFVSLTLRLIEAITAFCEGLVAGFLRVGACTLLTALAEDAGLAWFVCLILFIYFCFRASSSVGPALSRLDKLIELAIFFPDFSWEPTW